MSMFDSQQDSFEKSVSEYRNNANSVAQGALGSMGSLAGDSRAMEHQRWLVWIPVRLPPVLLCRVKTLLKCWDWMGVYHLL